MTVSDWGASFKFKSDFIMLFEKINNFINLNSIIFSKKGIKDTNFREFEKIGYKVEGIDLSSNMIKLANQKKEELKKMVFYQNCQDCQVRQDRQVHLFRLAKDNLLQQLGGGKHTDISIKKKEGGEGAL